MLGRVPEKGDEVTWSGFRLRVVAASDRQARTIEISPLEEGGETRLLNTIRGLGYCLGTPSRA